MRQLKLIRRVALIMFSARVIVNLNIQGINYIFMIALIAIYFIADMFIGYNEEN